MSLAADDADLPSRSQFQAALVGYLESGTRLAMYNSQPDADVVPQAPVPRWGWGAPLPTSPETPLPKAGPGEHALKVHGRVSQLSPDHRYRARSR